MNYMTGFDRWKRVLLPVHRGSRFSGMNIETWGLVNAADMLVKDEGFTTQPRFRANMCRKRAPAPCLNLLQHYLRLFPASGQPDANRPLWEVELELLFISLHPQ